MNSWSGPSCGDNCTASGTETEASFTISGTDPGKTYVVGLRAGNSEGWSSWVNSAPAEAPNPPPPPPDTPGPITVTRRDGQLHASWPADSNAIKYHVTYSSDHMNSWSATLCGDNCSGNEITIVNADNFKTYYVGVRAGNGSGWSDWRNSDAVLPMPPDPPSDVWGERVCDSSMKVWWHRSDGATGYDLLYSKDGGQTWRSAMINKNKGGFGFWTWNKHKTYWFAVRAVNSAGASAWVYSEATPPPPCEVGSLRAVTSTTHGQTGGSIVANWNAGKRASGYNVNYRASGGNWTRIASDVQATTHTGSVTGASGSYDVAVQSVNDLAMSKWRNTRVSAWLTASSVAGNDVTLSLAGHSGNWYVKQTSPTPAGDCSSAISGTTHAVSDLAADTQHTITAYSDNGCANAFAQAVFTTDAGLTVSDVKATSVKLNIAGHTAQWWYQADTGPDNTCQGPVAAGTSSDDLTGLTVHQQYTYTAYSASGCNSADLLDSITFEPSGDVLKVENLTATSATLKLENHTGNWWFKETAPNTGTCTKGEADFTNNLTGLIPGTEYTYKSYDVDTCGDTHEGASVTFTTVGVSVSNLGETGVQTCHVGAHEGITERYKCAIGFTTGSASNGYTLHSVTARFLTDAGNPGDLTVALHTASGSNPAASAISNVTLSGDSTPATTGNYTYTCSGAGCNLSAGTYFVVMSAPNAPVNANNGYRLRVISSTNEAKIPSNNGWLIENKVREGVPHWTQGNHAGMMKVAATVNSD